MSMLKTISNLGKAANDTFLLDPSEFRSQMSDMFFWGKDGKEYSFSYSSHTSSLIAYERCAPLAAIINKKAQAHINGDTWILNVSDGKEATSSDAKKLRKLLKKPNPFQSWKQFEAQQKIFIQIFGFSLVLPIIPAGFEKYGAIEATSMWNIPPNLLSIEETKRIFNETTISGVLKSVKLQYNGETAELIDKGIYIFKDFTPSFNTLLFPESRIRPLQLVINNIIGALESRNVLINYRGALGILSSDSDKSGYVPIKDPDKISLQNDFKRYGLRGQQWKFIITSALVKWQQIGIPTKDLMLIEEVAENTKSICDAYGYPPHLLGLIDPTFNNQNAAEKGLYQNTIIPEAKSMYEEWNNMFNTEKYGLIIDKDYSALPILQEDRTAQVTARKILDEALSMEYAKGLITLDEWLVELGKDPLPNAMGQVRATDPSSSSAPLAVTIGVGGVQGMISVLTAQGLSDSARQSILEVVFGIASSDASRMVTTDTTPATTETQTQPVNGN